MKSRTMERNPLFSLGRSKEVAGNMLREGVRERDDVTECIPGREWAEWFAAKRLSELRRKT